MTVWVDSGFLVALFARNDSHHGVAVEFMRNNPELDLHSVWPVIVEACFFLDTRSKSALLQWLERGAMTMHDITPQDLPLIRNTLQKYSDLKPDLTDAVLVAMADLLQIRRVLTVDVRDFSVYRFGDGGVFERLWV